MIWSEITYGSFVYLFISYSGRYACIKENKQDKEKCFFLIAYIQKNKSLLSSMMYMCLTVKLKMLDCLHMGFIFSGEGSYKINQTLNDGASVWHRFSQQYSSTFKLRIFPSRSTAQLKLQNPVCPFILPIAEGRRIHGFSMNISTKLHASSFVKAWTQHVESIFFYNSNNITMHSLKNNGPWSYQCFHLRKSERFL